MAWIYYEVGFDKMNWWKYLTGNYKKVSLLKVDYSLITMSGKTILELRETYKPEKDYCGNFGDWGQFEFIRSLEKDKDLKKKFDKRTYELLDSYQQKQRNHIAFGCLDGGNYIIKCVWDLFIETEYLTWEEAKNFVDSVVKGKSEQESKNG